MSNNIEENIRVLNEQIANIPKLDLKKLKVEDIDEADYYSLVGIGLTFAISAVFIWSYSK